jgi:predicted ester cyclase
MNRIKSIVSWFVNTSLARSLRFRIIGIVLLASLPTIGLLFLTASQARGDALDTAQQEANRIANIAASDQAREMDRIQRELSLLSRLPEVRSLDNSGCTPFFQSLVLSGENQIYVDLRVVGLNGAVTCRSSVSNPLGPNEDRGFIDQAIRQRQFTVGSYRINPLNGRSIISFAAPVVNEDGSVNRAIVATLDLGDQSTGLSSATLPEGSILSLVTEDGLLLLQEPPQETTRPGVSLVGTPSIDAAIGGGPEEGEEEVHDSDYIFASAEIKVTAEQPGDNPAFMIVQIPESEIVRRADTVFRDNLAKLGVSVSIAILAAWVSADLFLSRDTETRKTIVAELYHSFSSGVVDHLDTIVATNVVDHAALPDQAPGLDGLKQTIAAFRYAFPDGEVVPREMVAEKDKVMVRVSLTGTQVGEFQGLPPTGVQMIADGIETFAFKNGLISDTWSLMGPLMEMRVVEHPDDLEMKPQPPPPTFWQRITRSFRRNRNGNTNGIGDGP